MKERQLAWWSCGRVCAILNSLWEIPHTWVHSYRCWTEEIQTSRATTRHGTPNHLVRRVFRCGYNIFHVKMIIQWPSNGNCPVVQHQKTFSSTQAESNGDHVWQSLFFFITRVRCGFCAELGDFSPNSLIRRYETVLECTVVPFRVFLQQLFCQTFSCH